MVFSLLKKPYDVIYRTIWIIPLEDLSKYHLNDPDHTSPAHITLAIDGNGPVWHPNNRSEMLNKLMIGRVLILLSEQTCGLGIDINHNFRSVEVGNVHIIAMNQVILKVKPKLKLSFYMIYFMEWDLLTVAHEGSLFTKLTIYSSSSLLQIGCS